MLRILSNIIDPWFTLVTSTPNGIEGDGSWFFSRWNNAVDSDDLFAMDEHGNEVWRKDIDLAATAKDPNKNSFIRIQYHWSEDPTKDKEWYASQCQELDDQRLINQELDLVFVGSSACIFTDDQLSAFKPIASVSQVPCAHNSTLFTYQEKIDPNDYYLIGCDTAESLTGAFCAIEVFSFKNFNQVAELTAKFGSFTSFGEAIHNVFQYFYKIIGPRIILVIENNTIKS